MVIGGAGPLTQEAVVVIYKKQKQVAKGEKNEYSNDIELNLIIVNTMSGYLCPLKSYSKFTPP